MNDSLIIILTIIVCLMVFSAIEVIVEDYHFYKDRKLQKEGKIYARDRNERSIL